MVGQHITNIRPAGLVNKQVLLSLSSISPLPSVNNCVYRSPRVLTSLLRWQRLTYRAAVRTLQTGYSCIQETSPSDFQRGFVGTLGGWQLAPDICMWSLTLSATSHQHTEQSTRKRISNRSDRNSSLDHHEILRPFSSVSAATLEDSEESPRREESAPKPRADPKPGTRRRQNQLII